MGGTGEEEGTCPNKDAEENFPESRVEGCSSQDDDEVLDKSLKKARYVWQIKGNYHLKCSSDDKERSMSSECLQTESKQEAQVPSSNCSSDSSEDSDSEVDIAPSWSPPSQKRASPVWYRPRPDWPVLKWQTRQVAKAFVDNTINCVLEDMGFVPLPADSVDILDEDFSAPQREQNDNSLEDKAVLMAIQSHGLQRSDQDSSYQHRLTNYQRNERKLFCPSSLANLHCENSDIQQIHSTNSVTSNFYKVQNSSHAEYSDFLSDASDKGLSEIKNFTMSSDSQNKPKSEAYGNHKNKCSDVQRTRVFNPQILDNFACTCPARHSVESDKVESTSTKKSGESLSDCTSYFRECDSMDDTKNNSCNSIEPCLGLRSSSLSVSSKRPAEETAVSSVSKKRCIDKFDGSSESLSSIHLTASHNQASLVSAPNGESDGKLQSFEHFDFMDAAVVAAIQKKGLSALACTEYG